jgi:hypothetical protein
VPNLPVHQTSLTSPALWLAPDCSVAGNPLQCRLLSWLWALEAVAGILAFLLIVAGVFAYAVYRRNKARRLGKGNDA